MTEMANNPPRSESVQQLFVIASECTEIAIEAKAHGDFANAESMNQLAMDSLAIIMSATD